MLQHKRNGYFYRAFFALSPLGERMDAKQLTSYIDFMLKAENLKNTLRSAHTSIGKEESTAEHSWRLCLMLMLFSKYFESLNMYKILQLGIIHDLGEAVCGDIPAVAQVGGNKSAIEREAMCSLCAGLPKDTQAEFLALWDEYETANTAESKIVKGFDKLETIMQHNQGKNPPDFDYTFNLTYGKEYTDAVPLLAQIRVVLDAMTRDRETHSM